MKLFSVLWKKKKYLIGFLITVIFTWLAFGNLNLTALLNIFINANPFWIIVGLGFLAADYVLRIIRWWLMLRFSAHDLPFTVCTGPYLASIALNNILPFRIGDVVRAVGFQKQLGLSPMVIIGTMVIERLFDLFALLTVFLITLNNINIDNISSYFVRISYWVVLVCLLSLLLIIFIHLWFKRWVTSIVGMAKARKWRLLERMAFGMCQFFDSLLLIRSKLLVIELLILSFMAWFLEGAMFAAVAKALSIINISSGPWFSLVIGTLATLMPSTPGYIGTFDYFTKIGIMTFGVSQELGTVFALIVHIVLWAPLTLVGIIWLLLPAGRSVFKIISLRRGSEVFNEKNS